MKKLSKTQAWLRQHLEQEKALHQRLEQFEHENAENPQPMEASFRLDAGFGTYDNIALLIEMGYEVYVKLHNHKIAGMLQKSNQRDCLGAGGQQRRDGRLERDATPALPLSARYRPGAVLHRTDPQA
jgi:hypothetical protein